MPSSFLSSRGFISRSHGLCFLVPSLLVFNHCKVSNSEHLCSSHTWRNTYCKCCLVASHRVDLHSSCDSRNRQWKYGHFSAISFLILGTTLTAFELNRIASEKHLWIIVMSSHLFCFHLLRIQCNSGNQRVFHSTCVRMKACSHYELCTWRVPCAASHHWTSPLPQMTTNHYYQGERMKWWQDRTARPSSTCIT